MTNYYQNQRRYVKSIDMSQLQGNVRSPSDLQGGSCKPLGSQGDQSIYPCGLIANSMFNGESEVLLDLTKIEKYWQIYHLRHHLWPNSAQCTLYKHPSTSAECNTNLCHVGKEHYLAWRNEKVQENKARSKSACSTTLLERQLPWFSLLFSKQLHCGKHLWPFKRWTFHGLDVCCWITNFSKTLQTKRHRSTLGRSLFHHHLWQLSSQHVPRNQIDCILDSFLGRRKVTIFGSRLYHFSRLDGLAWLDLYSKASYSTEKAGRS